MELMHSGIVKIKAKGYFKRILLRREKRKRKEVDLKELKNPKEVPKLRKRMKGRGGREKTK